MNKHGEKMYREKIVYLGEKIESSDTTAWPIETANVCPFQITF